MTRLQSRRLAMGQGSADGVQIMRIVNNSLREFRDEISGMLADGLQNLSLRNLQPTVEERPTEQPAHEGLDVPILNSSNGQYNRESRGSQNVNRGFERTTENVLNLIRNWKVYFTGNMSDITVEEFIYRVNTLTNANLRGDFQILCQHAHILFEGKALKWYWRFHRSCDNMEWLDLCDALKRQYKDYYTDLIQGMK